jgi:hypothetical protein
MRVCDICKTRGVDYEVYATVNGIGETKKLELCDLCYRELKYREDRAKHQAYEETVKAMNGKIKRKSHWCDMFIW